MNIWTQWPAHILVSLAWCESKSGPGCRHLYLGLFCVSHSSQGSLLRSLSQARCTVNTCRDLESRQGTGRQNGNHRVTLWHIIGIFSNVLILILQYWKEQLILLKKHNDVQVWKECLYPGSSLTCTGDTQGVQAPCDDGETLLPAPVVRWSAQWTHIVRLTLSRGIQRQEPTRERGEQLMVVISDIILHYKHLEG